MIEIGPNLAILLGLLITLVSATIILWRMMG